MTPAQETGRPLVVLDGLLVNERPTGVGRSILELVGALAARDRGFRFLVLATHPGMFAPVMDAPHWRVLDCPGARGGTMRKAWFTQGQLPRLCRREGADLLHSLQFVAPVRLSCPSVVTVHDLAYRDFPGTVEQPRRGYYQLLVPRTLRRAQAVVTNSQATAQDTLRHFPELAGRVQATPFGTPSWVWSQPDHGEPASDEKPFFLFVGTLEPRKNLENLLRAYIRFLADQRALERPAGQVPGLRLIGGKGWRDSELLRVMDPLLESGDLEVLDYCGTADLWRSYRSARALLFPSLHEGFGFPILEAMAASLPVMTSGRGAMAEVAGGHALLVDPLDTAEMASAMDALAWDESLRQELVLAGPDHARRWSWEVTAEATCQVYRRVLGVAEEN